MTITVAVVGAGRMGRLHAKQLNDIPDVRIVGAADVRAEAVEEFTAEFGGTGSVDYRELLDRTSPDVAYFCTPAGEHLDQLTFAAERGINVFVEKPLAPSVTAATAAAEIIERHGVLCTVGYQWRYSPLTDVARDALAGLPPTMLAGWWYWTIPPLPWIRDRRTGGGQIFEQATHLIDLMRFLAGDVSTVFAAYADNAIPEEELPNWDASAVTLGFANGAAGSVHSTYALFPGIPGSNGVDVAAREVLVRVNLAKATVFRRGVPPEETAARAGWNIDQEFMTIVRRNDPPAVRATARESAQSIGVSLAANYSAVTKQVVDLRDFMTNPPDDATIMPL
ncbi:Gfo/Idh/MocA family protein [Actinopolymorpha rutila]|uniref:Putative dehydrogenase n=1 Tax=Actinopolymorpha rutila TaxID=446787 RepID=A0A852ZGV5_9ACTN|nr:Gfo/Idh/MocA family oxidoreductase [Actinopolymorpha rutila]NYH92154.1 putative dehydrogenase [Actinopolymorpha rutila]